VGHDAFVLIGVLALARFAVTAAAWDTANGFALMGASRDLTLAVFVEAALVLALGLAAVVTGGTDLTAMVAGAAGAGWVDPLLLLAAVPFAVALVAEVGRQPVDNPDTHLELTMIHEGPLLEYAGRDLALLQWVMAARHWVLFVLGAQLFLPHPGDPWWQLATLPVAVVALCAAVALTETLVAKMRVLAVPRLLAAAVLVALLGVVARLMGLI
jgi:formate hydrogenlyase subunit 4